MRRMYPVLGAALVGLGLGALWLSRPEPAKRVLAEIIGETTSQRAQPEAPHVVLIIGCTMRRDQTSLHSSLPTTPQLARLGEVGVVFEDAIVAAPWTRAASAAILTGHHALSLGLTEPGSGLNERVLPQPAETLAERFQAAGYRTLGLTTNPNLNQVYGFSQGFETYLQPAALWREKSGKVAGTLAVAQLLEHVSADQPTFLQVMLVDAHAPFLPTEDELAPFLDDDVPEDVQNYRGTLSRLDAAIGELLAGLEARGLDLSNSLFVVTNDHGEGLSYPPHQGKSHGRFLGPPAAGGVLVFAGKGVPRGVRVDGVVSQIDIAPTIAVAAGIEGDGFAGQPIDLASKTTDRRRAYVDTWFKDTSRTAEYESGRMCQVDFQPHIAARGRAEGIPFETGCFDRSSDPEHRNVLEDPSAVARIATWRRVQRKRSAAFGVTKATPSEDRAAQLEALGYVEGLEDADAQ